MHSLKTLVVMQLKDKLDLSWVKNKKLVIRNLVFFILKFLIVASITAVILVFSEKLGLFRRYEAPVVVILVLSISILLSLLTCTMELVKNLYFSEDNKVLITLPVKANRIFVSKLFVYFIYEMYKSFSFLVPITFSSVLFMIIIDSCSAWILLWMWVPLIFIIAFPVLLGALLSIPMLFIYRFIKKYPIIEIILFSLVLGLLIFGVVILIKMIPQEVNIVQQWSAISAGVSKFLKIISNSLVPIRYLVNAIFGEKDGIYFHLNLISMFKFVCFVGIDAVLYLLAYLLSRPLFFRMMSKNFELDKVQSFFKVNRKSSKYFTFVKKELKINLRTIEISINYLMVYIIVPILILLINTLFSSMSTSERGKIMIATFNVLLISLPLLASNGLVATYYSREGRAAYIKKTKPVNIVFPLLSKIIFNAVLSIPTVFATVFIYGGSLGFKNFTPDNTGFEIGEIIIFGFAILLLHYGHMIWSAQLDIMNPQNEQYATTGTTVNNPNENKSTLLAFVISIVYTLISYKLIQESSLRGNYYQGFTKLLIISLLFFLFALGMFIKYVKAYYYEIQGGR